MKVRNNRESHNYDHNDLCEVDQIDYFSSLRHPIEGKSNLNHFLYI